MPRASRLDTILPYRCSAPDRGVGRSRVRALNDRFAERRTFDYGHMDEGARFLRYFPTSDFNSVSECEAISKLFLTAYSFICRMCLGDSTTLCGMRFCASRTKTKAILGLIGIHISAFGFDRPLGPPLPIR